MIVETQPVPLSTVGVGDTFQEVGNQTNVFIVYGVDGDNVLTVRLNDGVPFSFPGTNGVIKRAFKAVPVA